LVICSTLSALRTRERESESEIDKRTRENEREGENERENERDNRILAGEQENTAAYTHMHVYCTHTPK
jgi:hypothetical protein